MIHQDNVNYFYNNDDLTSSLETSKSNGNSRTKGITSKQFMSSHDSTDRFRIRDRVDPSPYTNVTDLSYSNNAWKGERVNLN